MSAAASTPRSPPSTQLPDLSVNCSQDGFTVNRQISSRLLLDVGSKFPPRARYRVDGGHRHRLCLSEIAFAEYRWLSSHGCDHRTARISVDPKRRSGGEIG